MDNVNFMNLKFLNCTSIDYSSIKIIAEELCEEQPVKKVSVFPVVPQKRSR